VGVDLRIKPGEGNSMRLKWQLVLISSQYPLTGEGYTLANNGRSDYNKIKGA
jgi:hypothetical protein